MLQVFQSWFNDPLVQSVLISPLVGAIFGALFSGLTNSPSSAAPVTVHQTKVVFKQTIIVNQAGGKPPSQDDVIAYLIAGCLFIAGITWGYSRYSTEILGYWLSGLFGALSFILSAGAVSALRGQFSSSEWIWYIFAPLAFIGLSVYSVHLAELGILADASAIARQHGFIDFYMNVLNNQHRHWLLLQIIGVFFGILTAIAATLRSLHYLSLMNQRAGGKLHSMWHFFARATLACAGKGGIVLLMITAAVAYFTLSGHAYQLLEHRP